MKILKYMLPKLIWKNLKIFISLVLISAMGIGLLTALLNSYGSVTTTMDDFFEEYCYPDVTLMTNELITEREVKEIESESGVVQAAGRLVLDEEAIAENGKAVTLRCFSKGDADFLKYHSLERYKKDYEKTYIPMGMEACFVELAGFQLGDTFSIQMNGKTYTAILAETVLLPEWTAVYRDENYIFSTDEFGYAMVAYEDLKTMTGVETDLYNQILVLTDESQSPEAIEQRILENQSFVKDSYTYESSPHKTSIDGAFEPLKNLSYLLSGMFFLIAMVMTYLFVYQLIGEQRAKMGTLMAIGADYTEIAAVYVAFGGLVAVCAGITGNLLGYGLMQSINGTYQRAYYLPEMKTVFSMELIWISFVMIALIILFSVSMAVVQIFKMEPSEAMRRQTVIKEPPKRRKLLDKLGYVEKVCIQCTLRNKRRMGLSLAATVLTAALIVFSMQYLDAQKYALQHSFEERFTYDGQIFFDGPLSEEKAASLLSYGNEIRETELFSIREVTLKSDSQTEDISLYCIEKKSKMVHLFDKDKKELELMDQGMILSGYHGEELSVETGDTIKVENTQVEITGIHEENLVLVPYCSRQTLQQIDDTEDHTYQGAFFTLKEGEDPQNLYDALYEKEGFSYLTMKDAQKAGMEEKMQRTTGGVYVVILMTFLLGLVIIYNMSLINFKERKKVFSTMLALGMKEKDIARASTLELMIQFIISMILGFLIGTEAGKVILVFTSNENIRYLPSTSVESTMLMIGGVAAFMLAGHLLAMRKLKKLNLIEELKAEE